MTVEPLFLRLNYTLTSLSSRPNKAEYLTCSLVLLGTILMRPAEADMLRRQAMSGWVVKITKAGDFTVPKLYAIAEADPRRALYLVNKAADGAPPADRVETVGELSPDAVHNLGLAPEEIRDVTANPPVH